MNFLHRIYVPTFFQLRKKKFFFEIKNIFQKKVGHKYFSWFFPKIEKSKIVIEKRHLRKKSRFSKKNWFFFNDPKNIYFFKVEKKKLGYSFEVKIRELSIYGVFGVIPALCHDSNSICRKRNAPRNEPKSIGLSGGLKIGQHTVTWAVVAVVLLRWIYGCQKWIPDKFLDRNDDPIFLSTFIFLSKKIILKMKIFFDFFHFWFFPKKLRFCEIFEIPQIFQNPNLGFFWRKKWKMKKSKIFSFSKLFFSTKK